MSAAALLLDRLGGVRETGPSRWIARCPAHEDRNPSLSVRELDDGRVLLHDFGGCDVQAVLAALGLTLADLFERPSEPHLKPARAWLDARDALACLAIEGRILAIAASDLATGAAFSAADVDRIAVAAGRVHAAWVLCHGR
jgi:hypothetical protein